MQTTIAKYTWGKCPKCASLIQKGQSISLYKKTPRRWGHTKCYTPPKPKPKPKVKKELSVWNLEDERNTITKVVDYIYYLIALVILTLTGWGIND